MLVTVPAGFAALSAAIQEIGQKQHAWLMEQVVAALGTVLVVFLTLLGLTWAYLLKPATL